MDESEIKANANIFPLHAVYKLTNEENNVNIMRVGLCPNGNRDRLKKTVRKYSTAVQFDFIRVLL